MAMHTPPNPVRRLAVAPPPTDQSPYTSLLKLFDIGVITKEELRERVLALKPSSAKQRTPLQESQDNQQVTSPKKRKPDKLDNDSRFNKKLNAKKTRLGRPTDTVATLREISKDVVRRRFFYECANKNSCLWVRNGTFEIMDKLLFAKAAQDCIDIIYRNNPGETRGVKENKLLQIINWRVYKDRQNYKKKGPPKRLPFLGAKLPFDFKQEMEKLHLFNHVKAEPQKVDCQPQVKPQVHRQVQPQMQPQAHPQRVGSGRRPLTAEGLSPPQPCGAPPLAASSIPSESNRNVIDLDLMAVCSVCGLGVWTGEESKVPHGVTLAFPKGSDWEQGCVEPFCDSCWEFESNSLEKMGAENFKAIGPVTNTTAAKKAKKAEAKKAEAAAAKKAKKAEAAAAKKAKRAEAAAAKKAETAAKKMKFKVSIIHRCFSIPPFV